MDLSEVEGRIHELEHSRMYFAPDKYLKKFVQSTADIYNERILLRDVELNNDSIEYIVTLIMQDLETGTRFRKVECFKVLYRILANRSSDETYSRSLSMNLFQLFKNYIFDRSKETQRIVSTFIQDVTLEEDGIRWLIAHFEESEYILGALLNYPVPNEEITNWARCLWEEGKLQDRGPELVAVMVDKDIPDDLVVDHTTLMRAIFYSRCSKGRKKKLLLKYLDYDNYSTALEVAQQLGIGEISKELLKHYRQEKSNSSSMLVEG